MLTDTAIGYICFTIGFIGLCGLGAFIAHLVYLHESKVEEDKYYKEKSDIYE